MRLMTYCAPGDTGSRELRDSTEKHIAGSQRKELIADYLEARWRKEQALDLLVLNCGPLSIVGHSMIAHRNKKTARRCAEALAPLVDNPRQLKRVGDLRATHRSYRSSACEVIAQKKAFGMARRGSRRLESLS